MEHYRGKLFPQFEKKGGYLVGGGGRGGTILNQGEGGDVCASFKKYIF